MGVRRRKLIAGAGGAITIPRSRATSRRRDCRHRRAGVVKSQSCADHMGAANRLLAELTWRP